LLAVNATTWKPDRRIDAHQVRPTAAPVPCLTSKVPNLVWNAVNFRSGTSGGGITAVTVNLTNCTVNDNITGGGGGGISCSAAANLTRCTVSDNSASSVGGGISCLGTATLIRSTVRGNSAGSDGGGIDALTAILTNTTVSDNVAANDAGVGANTVTLTGSTVTGNHAVQDSGGIGANMATLTDCTVSGNSAGQTGGGVYVNFATLTNTTVSGNSSGGNGAGIDGANSVSLSDSTVSGNHAIGDGGGIFAPGSLSLVASTVSGNSAVGATGNGGGIYAYNPDVVNCTISGNSAAGSGGGIFMSGISILLFDTIADNSAGNGGGICRATNGATQSVQDSIIALNLVTFGGAGPDVDGGFLSQGNNLIGILDSAGNSSFTNGVHGDQVGSVSNPLLPGLSALGFHGGPTETFALLANSKALNAGDNAPLASLEVAVGANDTTFSPGEVANFAVGMVLRLDHELVLVVGVNSTNRTITVQRGFDGTVRAPHSVNTGLFIATDQRGDPRPDGRGLCDIGAFQHRITIGNAP
jgi:predicted outer membrane repeat protein